MVPAVNQLWNDLYPRTFGCRLERLQLGSSSVSGDPESEGKEEEETDCVVSPWGQRTVEQWLKGPSIKNGKLAYR